nr:ABC transporter substrate-binding protein [Paenibacillus bovis]
MRKIISPLFLIVVITSLLLSGCFGKKDKANGDEKVAVNPAGVFPIVDEKVTLKVLVHGNALIENFETNEFTKWYEEKTNVHIEWEVVPQKGAKEKLNLILTSGDYPDVILNFGVSPTEQLVYGQQGIFLPLNKYIDEYGKETKELFRKYPKVKDVITAPNGNIYALPRINENYHGLMGQKMWIYTPWLEKLNLKMPTTTDEFYEVLKAFKTKDPNGNGKADEIPLAGATTGWNMNIENFLMNSFIFTNKTTSNRMIFNEEGEIDVVFNKDGWREGLKYLNKLYSEGLLVGETFTQDKDQLKQMGDHPGVPILGTVAAGIPQDFADIGGDRWSDYETVPPLKGPNGLQVTPFDSYPMANGVFIITSAAKYPEVAFRWADAMFSEEITLRAVHGRPDIEWRWAEDGELGINGEPGKWKKLISFGSVQNSHWYQTGTHIQDEALRSSLVGEEGNIESVLYNETKEKYAPYQQDPEKMVPPLFFTEEQANELATLQKSINDYVGEMVARFVTGDQSLEKDWDKYIETLESMNLKRFVEIHNEAYETQYK